jgi:hypothetical protein
MVGTKFNLLERLGVCIVVFMLISFGRVSAESSVPAGVNQHPHICILFFNKTSYYDRQKEGNNYVVKPNPVSLHPEPSEYYSVEGDKPTVLKKVFSSSGLDKAVKCNKLRQLSQGKLKFWKTDDCTNHNYLCTSQKNTFACVINVPTKELCDTVSNQVRQYFSETHDHVLACIDEKTCSVHQLPGRSPTAKQDFYIGPVWLNLSKQIITAFINRSDGIS